VDGVVEGQRYGSIGAAGAERSFGQEAPGNRLTVLTDGLTRKETVKPITAMPSSACAERRRITCPVRAGFQRRR
jgi:hypothetical protein